MFVVVMVYVVWGCNSNGKKKADEIKTYNQTGVPNVNGNIPDTTNAIDLSTHKKDTTGKPAESVK